MKARILELIIDPESIVSDDLQLLKEEIAVQPYAQSLRALHLLGIKKYDSAQFQKELSTTAAFTTDKKVLYQFINGEKYEPKSTKAIDETPILENKEISQIEKEISTPEIIVDQNENEEEGNWLAEVPKKELPKKVVLNGEVNRILFVGEENFLNEATDAKIDIEATAEAGVLVTEKIEDVPNENVKPQIITEKSPEKFKTDLLSIKSEISQEKSEIFLNKQKETPQNFEEKEPKEIISEVQNLPKDKAQKTVQNKYEIERKKLAEEIERKMSQSKKTSKNSTEEDNFEEDHATVDFFQTQDFSIQNKADEKIENNFDATTENQISNIDQASSVEISEKTDDLKIENSNWKPMGASENTSSRFKKEEDLPIPQKMIESTLEEDKPENVEKEHIENKEIAALDISFFTPAISSIHNEEKTEISEPVIENEKSNIPVFINTWQSWLKIDRFEEKIEDNIPISKEKNKLEAIEKFIDNAPKISKFKEDNNYAVPEKKDDISHLMTETLANLFWTQNLYSKAINAYKILITKHPEKTGHYNSKIEEIQASRQK